MSPDICCTICWHKANPIPVPWMGTDFNWAYLLKTVFCFSGGIPGPESSTHTSIVQYVSDKLEFTSSEFTSFSSSFNLVFIPMSLAPTWTNPRGTNFTAFLVKFITTCFNRRASARTHSGSSVITFNTGPSDVSDFVLRIFTTGRRTSWRIEIRSGFRTISPHMTLFKSSMFVTKSLTNSKLVWIASRFCPCESKICRISPEVRDSPRLFINFSNLSWFNREIIAAVIDAERGFLTSCEMKSFWKQNI